jgi:tape measure domain-containing protein
MADLLQYTLSLRDMISDRLQRINITTDAMLDRFGSLERLQRQVSQEFSQMGSSVSTLQSRINLLRAERDLLPANGLTTIRTYNREINRLERQVTNLQNNTGGRLQSWFSQAMAGLPGLATNPLILAGAGLGMAIRTGMESDLQKTNITTLLKGDVEKAKALYAQLSDYGVKTPYDKAGLIEAQKTMMSFGLSSEFAFGKLKNIGDIAMGDAQKMKSLSLAFAQATSAGKLQGQDLMQMINAGFNPLQVISERTGESMASLKERMRYFGSGTRTSL